MRLVAGVNQTERCSIALAITDPLGGVVHVVGCRVIGQREQRRPDAGLAVVRGRIWVVAALLAADGDSDLAGQTQDRVLRAQIYVIVAGARPQIWKTRTVSAAAQMPLASVAAQIAKLTR